MHGKDSPLQAACSALIEEGYRESWGLYQQSLEPPAGRRPQWDLVVLTAADARQAKAFELQIEQRRKAGLLPRPTQFLVVPDPGRRIGSGGATVHTLGEIARNRRAGRRGRRDIASLFAGQRILLLHSGGESRRLPHCSAFGKVFARVPHELPDGRPSTLFDEFLISLAGLPYRMREGVFVASGDVLLLFDHRQLDLARQGVVGVAARAPVATGAHHGVYVSGPDGHAVKQFLHKAGVDELAAAGAVAPDNSVAIDTGMLWMDPEVVAELLSIFGLNGSPRVPGGSLYNKLIADGAVLNFYGDFLMPLAAATRYEDYLNDASDGPATDKVRQIRQVIWEKFRGVPFRVQSLAPAEFIHFGATAEYLDSLSDGMTLYGGIGWSTPVASYTAGDATPGGGLVVQGSSVAAIPAGETAGCVIEDCSLQGPLLLAPSCLLSHVWTAERLDLPAGAVVHQLPILATDEGEQRGFVTRIHGVRDNPKLPADHPDATFLNRPWGEWFAAAALTPEDLWDDGEAERSLWTARLFPLAHSREESLALVRWMLDPAPPDPEAIQRWQLAPRLSLGESARRADMLEILSDLRRLNDQVRVERFGAAIRQEQPSATVIGLFGDRPAEARRRVLAAAERLERAADPILNIRGYKYLADALFAQPGDRSCMRDARRFEDRAFDTLAQLIRDATPQLGDAPIASGGPRQAPREVGVRAAVRIDFAGGWSDTPPFSLEYGGRVFNAALRLRGELPVRVACAVLDRPVLVLESRDLGVVRKFDHADAILDYADPSDPLALHKAALVLQGIAAGGERGRRSEPLARLLDGLLGGGLHVTTDVNVPHGSGLGTSSILAGALLACLRALVGRPVDLMAIYDEVLCLEQMLTTGGGWQDQVGGLFGGIKLSTTRPGLPQRPTIEPVTLSPEIARRLHERLLLLYTGQRRLAKGILRTVMGRFMSREPEAFRILCEIREIAWAQRRALERGDCDEMGRLMAEHWDLNKRLDPGMSNPYIDRLFEACRPFLSGAKLAGAGGGGFMMVMARDEHAPAHLARVLAGSFPHAEIWPCEIADEGLIVTEK